MTSSLIYAPSELLFKPVFAHGVSISLHLAFLGVLLFSWVWRRTKVGPNGVSEQRKTKFSYHKQALWCSWGISLLNLLILSLNCFDWYIDGWSDQTMATTLLDSLLRTLSWFATSLYLHLHFPYTCCNNLKFPIWFRVWWGFYFVFSCCFLLIDSISGKKTQSQPTTTMFLVFDGVSTLLSGLLFCFVGVFAKKMGVDTLEEPLLNLNNSEKNISPRSNANILSILTFSWMTPLISSGYKKTLNLDDIPQLPLLDTAKGAYPVFKNSLDSGSVDGNGNGYGITTVVLVKALFYTTRREILLSGVLALINTLASYVGPYLIETFVRYLSGSRKRSTNQGLVLVFAFLGAKLMECLAQRHFLLLLQEAGIRARGVFITMIYQKGLTVKQGNASGEIINLVAVDADKLGNFAWYVHDLWLVVLQVVLALLILYKNLGVASISALAATFLVMLLNLPLANYQEKIQEGLMKSKDERIKVTSEVLRNMKILKLQAWEMKLLSKIVHLREIEAGWLVKYLYAFATTVFVFWVAPTLVSVATFGTCVILGIPLDSGKVLSSVAVFKLLQMPIYNLPDTISVLAQTKVSLDRIASFLRSDDVRSDVVERLIRFGSENSIEIINGNFSWDSPTLKDINLKVSHGMNVAVCGTVGSGKSSLLSCILGEMKKTSGEVKLCGEKAYVAQSPWIQSGKIEENVLFGKAMDRRKYEMVLEACALKKDLEILPFGDQTVIGERGINLSGGQKQRIQIARALYQDADVYLFDDPFSAVDAHTGSHLFKECILRLLGSKTVVYVTHQVEFLPAADLILVMKDGRITEAGKYNDLLNTGSDFKDLVYAHQEALAEIDCKVTESTSRNLATTEEENIPKEDQNHVVDDNNAEEQKHKQIVQEEEREKGQVGLSVYWKFATTAYKGALVPLIVSAAIFFQMFQIGSNYWLAWATPVSEDMVPPVGSPLLILVYAGLAIGSSICIFFRTLVLNIAGYKTATILFTRMHSCIFRAPMSFFDSTPSGRILNRASTDQSAVDLEIPTSLGGLVFRFIELFGIIGVMSQVAWQVLFVFLPVIASCIWLQQRYIRSGRELARLGGVSKAPVIQHFAETISGVTTIRSFGQEPRFLETCMELIDGYSRPTFYSAGAMEWLCFRMDVLSAVTLAFSLVFLTFAPQGTINPSIAGLALTYGLTLNEIQSRIIWNLCNVENKIISVERLLQYTAITSEPPLVIDTSRPNSHWPTQGEIVIQDLQVRYASHMPLVLRGITCTFGGGMRTGIVGRTGSGKSTLIQTLFRVVDPAAGRILIDEVDINMIGLHDLRSRLSIIPQDPTMFQGSVRSNLDPLEEYTDEQIWEALDKCQLGDEVRKKEEKLESSVSENGENWSMGQRQLVCLGRVLLKKSKVLVLDEATASVDTASDNKIQQTLRQHFSGCTVLTIAHRITSVVDSDMVLLLDHGLVEEYDSPNILLQNKSSSFAKLVAEYSSRSNSTSNKSL